MENASQIGVYDRPTNLDIEKRSGRRSSLMLGAGAAMVGILFLKLLF